MMSSRFLRFLTRRRVRRASLALGSRYLLNQYMSFEAAVAVAYLFGVVTAYLLARLFVFQKSGHKIATEFRRFAVVNIISLAVVWSDVRSGLRST